jgi:hypothetical protein
MPVLNQRHPASKKEFTALKLVAVTGLSYPGRFSYPETIQKSDYLP